MATLIKDVTELEQVSEVNETDTLLLIRKNGDAYEARKVKSAAFKGPKGDPGTGGGTPDDEDLETVEKDGADVMRLKDRAYAPAEFSGKGRQILRRNVQTVTRRATTDITDTMTKTEKYYYDLSAGVGGTAKTSGRWSMGYLTVGCKAGARYVINGAYVSTYGKYMWGVIDASGKILQCGGESSENDMLQETVDVATAGTLVVNIVIYENPAYSVSLSEETDTTETISLIGAGSLQGENSVITIRYDFDANGGRVVMPAGCTLRFEGGSISNAVIEGDGTTIVADADAAILKGCTLLGTWRNTEWYPEWMGAVGDGEADDYEPIQQILDLTNSSGLKSVVCRLRRTYRVTKGLVMGDSVSLCGIAGTKTATIVGDFDDVKQWIVETRFVQKSTGRQMHYNIMADWASWDNGAYASTTYGVIQDLTIKGVWTSAAVDGKDYRIGAPIYGGVRLNGTYVNTRNLAISGVVVGMARSVCINTRDELCVINAYHVAYRCYAMNGCTLMDIYLNARDAARDGENNLVYMPWTDEYELSTSASGAGKTIINGDGGETLADGEKKPACTSFKAEYAYMMDLHNIVIDATDAALVLGNSSVTINCIWLEGVGRDYVHNYASTVWLKNPYVYGTPTYDFSGSEGTVIVEDGGNARPLGLGYFDKTRTGMQASVSDGYYTRIVYPQYTKLEQLYVPVARAWFVEVGQVMGGLTTYLVNANHKWAKNTQMYRSAGTLAEEFPDLMKVKAATAVMMDGRYVSMYGKDLRVTGTNGTTSVLTGSGSYLNIGAGRNVVYDTLTLDGWMIPSCAMEVTYKNCTIYVTGDINKVSKVSFIGCKIYRANGNEGMNNAGTDTEISWDTATKIYGNMRMGLARNKNAVCRYVTNQPTRGTRATMAAQSWHAPKGMLFDCTDDGRTYKWNGQYWLAPDGYDYMSNYGAIADRPNTANMRVGSTYYASDEGKEYRLTALGTCGYGQLTAKTYLGVFTEPFYIGTTLITPATDGTWTAELPKGRLYTTCEGYTSSAPAVIAAAGELTVYLSDRLSCYVPGTKYAVTLHVTDGDGVAVTGKTVVVGGVKATESSTEGTYTVSLCNGSHYMMVEGYSTVITISVGGEAVEEDVAVGTALDMTDTVTVTGTAYDTNRILNTSGEQITAGKVTWTVNGETVTAEITADDLTAIAMQSSSQVLPMLLLRAWVNAGHYGYTSGHSVRMCADEMGAVDMTPTITENTTGLVITTEKASGKAATWSEITYGAVASVSDTGE